MFRSLRILTAVTFSGLLIACAPAPPQAVDGVLDLRGNSNLIQGDILRLDGEWEFFPERFLASEERPDRTQRIEPLLVPVPDHWSNYRVDGRELPVRGYATFRLRVLLDEPMPEMIVRVREASMSYRLYVNGELVVTEGRAGRNAAETIPAANRMMSAPLRLERENEILVEVANFHFFEGGIRKGVRLGGSATMQGKRLRGQRATTLLVGAFAFMALYHLLLFGLERREKAALAFAIMCVGIIFRISLINERVLLDAFPDVDYIVFLKILMLNTYMVLPACGFFLVGLFPKYISSRFAWVLAAGVALLAPVIVFNSPIVFMHTVPFFSLLVLLGGMSGLFQLTRAIRAGAPDSGIFFFAFCAFLLTAFNDLLYAQRIIQTDYYAEYGFSAFVFSQAFTVSRRILASRRLSESLAGDLEKSNERLLSLDRLKDEFLANTSHELRTPLQGIIGIADSLREETPHERRLALIAGSGRRLSELVNDILDFSKLRYRDIRLHPVPIQLKPFAELQRELADYGRRPEKGQTARLHNEIAEDLWVLADEARLAQIFQNLLGNAVKYAPQSEIRIRATELDGWIAVEVQDSGPGIAADRLERIFEPFEQARANYRSGEGVGLGLSIARSLTELHGGTLTAVSDPGQGSTFRFTLPRATPGAGETKAPDARPDAKPAPVSFEPVPPRLAEVTPVTWNEPFADNDDALVLLVDDEPVNLEVMRSFLKNTAVRTVLAESAIRAREIIATGPRPDLVVLDIMMPEVSGLEYLRELRLEYSQIELPVLMVTAMTRTGDLLNALDAGASDYLTKPFEKEEFLLRVKNLTALSRTRSAVQRATRAERERMNADLHDHLGGNLIDLQLMGEQALEEPGHERKALEGMYEKITGVIEILRNDMLGLEDLDLLEENFWEGIQLILLRRYIAAGRELNYYAPENLPTIDPHYGTVLHAVLTEIANNDLKYGSGPALLRFTPESQDRQLKLVIEFESRSHYRLENHGTGRGTAGMIRRLSEIGGTLQIAIDQNSPDENRPIQIRIRLDSTKK